MFSYYYSYCTLSVEGLLIIPKVVPRLLYGSINRCYENKQGIKKVKNKSSVFRVFSRYVLQYIDSTTYCTEVFYL